MNAQQGLSYYRPRAGTDIDRVIQRGLSLGSTTLLQVLTADLSTLYLVALMVVRVVGPDPAGLALRMRRRQAQAQLSPSPGLTPTLAWPGPT